MKELKGNYFFCKTLRLFNHLLSNNCKFIKAVPDKTNSSFQIFMFKNDINLKIALDNYHVK